MEKIPKPAVKRLAMYYRCLERFKGEGREYVSSKEMAKRLGIKACQIRKDLSYFGEFGKRGVGYRVDELMDRLREILGIEKLWKIVIVGAGNLGKALAGYPVLREHGFEIAALFDIDRRKVGKKVGGIPVKHMEEFEDFVKENNIRIAVLTVPREAAQEVAERVEKAGVEGILNFSPTVIKACVPVENVDISVALKSLTFQIIRKKGKHGC